MKPGQTLRDLVDLTSRLSRERELDDALQQVADAALQLLQAEQASIRLVDAEQGGLVLRAGARRGRKTASAASLDDGVAKWVCQHGRPVRIDDVRIDKRFGELHHQGAAGRSVVAVPLWVGGRVVGVLAASASKPGLFAAEQEGQARLLASCAAPLIERARSGEASLLARLEHVMASPLRLRLVAELLERAEEGLSLRDAVLASGRHAQDVEACLRPLVELGVVEQLADGARVRMRGDLEPAALELVREQLRLAADDIGRERHVRHQLLGGMIGVDPKMQLVFEMVGHMARLDVPVLITGETGTGKELVARAIHDTGGRRGAFFGAINCATLTETLFESQVFGHARGAFTGAVHDFVGLVERCHRGTLFLDEVGDLSLANQVKLLRLLQEGTFTRLGETTPRQSDFRLISATNRNLVAMVAAGAFREDLYYRLAVFPMRLPSLRERPGDLEYLVDGILTAQAPRFGRGDRPPEVTPEALDLLRSHSWPGNVRELENVLARAVIMAGEGPVKPEHLPALHVAQGLEGATRAGEPAVAVQTSTRGPGSEAAEGPGRSLRDVEREHIEQVLRSQGGNVKATALVLGVSRTTLYKKLRDYGIEVP